MYIFHIHSHKNSVHYYQLRSEVAKEACSGSGSPKAKRPAFRLPATAPHNLLCNAIYADAEKISHKNSMLTFLLSLLLFEAETRS